MVGLDRGHAAGRTKHSEVLTTGVCTCVCNRNHRLPPPVLPDTLSCDPQSSQLRRTSGSCDRGFSGVLAEQRAQALSYITYVCALSVTMDMS